MNSSTSWWDMSFSTFSRRTGSPCVVEPDLDLGKIEIERAGREAVLAQEGGQFPGGVQLLGDLRRDDVGLVRHERGDGVHRFSAEDGERLLVSEAGLAADDACGRSGRA